MARISPKTAVIVEKQLSYAIVNAFYEVYNKLGYGFLESVYAKGLENALKRRGVPVEREYLVTVILDDEPIGTHDSTCSSRDEW